ncbi:MAG: hypothetical protein QGG40_16380, partial [Myxococcota bacterium]|nr:hypothetical protein [Myxococcota bacterium]
MTRIPPGRLAAVLVAAVALIALWPVLPAPHQLALGRASGEGPAHLWGLWTTAEGLWTHGPFLRVSEVNHPAGLRAELIDPVNLLVFWPVWWVTGGGATGAVLGWNAIHLAAVVAAGWGGWLLATRILPDAPCRLVLVAATAGTPYLLASLGLGRTEYLAGAWYVLHLAFLHRHLSTDRRATDTLAALASLVGLAHSGWIVPLWVLLIEPPLAIIFARQLPGTRTRVTRIAQVALPAVLLSLPVLFNVLDTSPWWLTKTRYTDLTYAGPVVPIQSLLPGMTNAAVGGGAEAAPYPGALLVALAILGSWKYHRARGWLLLGGLLFVAALGREVQWAGAAGPEWKVYMPIAWLTSSVQLFRGVTSWSRLGMFLGFPLGVAAAWGVHALGKRW